MKKEKYKHNKYVRQVFANDNLLTSFLRKESTWLLERWTHKFEVADAVALLQLITDYRIVFC